MTATTHFKDTIKAYLDERAANDELFASVYGKPNKNINDCITFILNSVKKSGCNGFTDDEIYSMAVHYYDEDGIQVGKPMNCKVMVNHAVELTEEEKAQARKAAMKRAEDEAYDKMNKLRNRTAAAKQRSIEPQQKTLFDL
jgi:hypothetical protein